MMSPIETHLPAGDAALRAAVYQGTIFQLPAVDATQRLVAEVRSLLEEELGRDGPFREAQFRLSDEAFFHAIGRLRKVLYEEPRFFTAIQEILRGFGFRPEENALDPLRLRTITHCGHENPRAAPIYYTHRDTWYSHPQCQISWWIPLHDVREEETFVFFPDYLDRPVPNNSEEFDYDDWIRDRRSLRIGWQDSNAGTKALYPGFQGELQSPREVGFSCRQGEILIFAGAHLHRTLANTTGRTRFSMDFRTVHLEDHRRGIGAPNADNRSTGSALQDYFHPSEAAHARA
jgi:hypothetical protein